MYLAESDFYDLFLSQHSAIWWRRRKNCLSGWSSKSDPMNPFLVFLILVPLLVSLIIFMGSILSLIQRGPRWDIILAVVLFGVLSGYLILVLRGIFTMKASVIEFPWSSAVNESMRKRFTTFILTITFLVLFLMAVLLLNIESLRNWFGIGFFFFGLAMLLSGISSVRYQSSGTSDANKLGLLEKTLSVHLRIGNLVLILHPIIGVGSVGLYWFSGGVRYFSIWDLYGFLFLLGSSCAWFYLYGKALQKQVDASRKKIGGIYSQNSHP